MFTDMVGSSALAQTNEELALRLREEQERLLRSLFATHQGREVKTMGDGFLVEFASALRAVECALAIQEQLRERNAHPELTPLRLRIGIHLGDVEEQGGDIHGDSVNLASRIEPLAEPGGICLTEPVFGQVRNKLDIRFEKLPPPTLKNIVFPMEVYRIVLPSEPEGRASNSGGAVRLAVLPFANISPDPTDEYLADGLTEELISALSRVEGLRVISRTSVMKFKDSGKTIAEIGRELNVTAVLEGSVRKARESLRVTVQLIDVRSDEHRWSESYDRKFADVFEIQSDIAGRVSQSLPLRLRDSAASAQVSKPTDDLEAYTLYLRGRREWNKLSALGFQSALGYYQRALQRDSNYALAYAGIADCYWSMGYFHILRENEAFTKAEEFARQALGLDEGLAEAHASLAVTLFQFERKPEEAEREFRRALHLNPSFALGHLNYSNYLVRVDRCEAGVAEVHRAVELDPLSVLINTMAGYTLGLAGRPTEALGRLTMALDLEPGFPLAHNDLGWVYASMGRLDDSIRSFNEAVRLSGESPFYRCNLALAYARAGETEPAIAILKALEAESPQRYVSPYYLARAYALLGEPEKALHLLERAVLDRSIHWNALAGLRSGSEFDKLRSDPRFQQLLGRLEGPSS